MKVCTTRVLCITIVEIADLSMSANVLVSFVYAVCAGLTFLRIRNSVTIIYHFNSHFNDQISQFCNVNLSIFQSF